MLTLDTVGSFTWDFGCNFHIETSVGCFVWSDPSYNGDNTIKPAPAYNEWIGKSFGRYKGQHLIRDFCGKDVKIMDK